MRKTYTIWTASEGSNPARVLSLSTLPWVCWGLNCWEAAWMDSSSLSKPSDGLNRAKSRLFVLCCRKGFGCSALLLPWFSASFDLGESSCGMIFGVYWFRRVLVAWFSASIDLGEREHRPLKKVTEVCKGFLRQDGNQISCKRLWTSLWRDEDWCCIEVDWFRIEI